MRLLLIEDHDDVAFAMAALLARQGFTVRHAPSGEEALQTLVQEGAGFGVILLDLGLPDQDGFEVLRQIRERSATPVIIVTARSDVRARIYGLNLGADGYIVKPFDSGELIARIHAVVRRCVADGPSSDEVPRSRKEGVVCVGPLRIDTLGRQVSVGKADVKLTRKEFDLLALLAQRPGAVFRREYILNAVWHSTWEGDGHNLTTHIASLRTKLRLPALIETVYGVGYRLVHIPPYPGQGLPPSA